MTKLVDKRSGQEVEIPGASVKAALGTGQFSFPAGRNVPIVQNGEAKWVDPAQASKYWQSLDFTDDQTVQQFRADQRFGGLGGAALGLGLGVAKTATLGLGPLLAGAVSDTAREAMRDIELAQPVATGIGELGGLAVDPFAALGRKGAAAAAETVALPAAGRTLALPAASTARAAEGAVAREALALPAAREAAMLPPAPIPMPSSTVLGGEAARVAEAAAPEAAVAARAPYQKPTLTRRGTVSLGAEPVAAETVAQEAALAEPPLMLGTGVPEMLPSAAPAPSVRAGRAAQAAADARLTREANLRLPPAGREPSVTPAMVERPADLSSFSLGKEATVPTLRQPLSRLTDVEKEAISGDVEDADVFIREAINDLTKDRGRFIADGYDLGESGAQITGTALPPKRGKGAGNPYDFDVLSMDDIANTGADAVTIGMTVTENPSLRALTVLERAVPEAELKALRVKAPTNSYTVVWDAEAAAKAWEEAGGKANKANPFSKKPDPEQPFWAISPSILQGSTKSAKRSMTDLPRATKMEQIDNAAVMLRDDLAARYQAVQDRVGRLAGAIEGRSELLYPSAEKAGQLSFAELSLPALERFEGAPTAMTGRLEFGRGAEELAAARAGAREELRLGRLAAEREAQREAIRRGGLPPERIGLPAEGLGAEVPMPLLPAGAPGRAGVAEAMAAEDAARAQAAQAAAARPAAHSGAIVPYPTLPTGAADTGLREALVAQREAANMRALPPRGVGVTDVQAAQRAAVEEVMRARDAAATSELRSAVQADIDAGRYGVPPERAIQLGQRPGALVAPEVALPGEAPQAVELAAQAAAPEAAAAAAIDAARGGLELGKGAALAAQGAVYGGASQAQREQLGLEEGAPGSVLKAAFLGGAIPVGMMSLLGGGKAAASRVAQAVGSDGAPLGVKFAQAMDRLEESAVLNMFGMNKAQIRELNASIGAGINEQRGTRNFVDFVRRSIGDIESLKREFPDDALLNSIRLDRKFQLGNMKPEQRVAFADALRESYGRAIEKAYAPFAARQISTDELLGVLGNVRRELIGRGSLSDIPMQSIRQEFNALENYLMGGGTHTVGSLRDFEKSASRLFRESVGVGNPFTEAQQTFRNAIKDTYLKAVEAGAPGTSENLSVLNRAYQMAERLAKGAASKEATLASRLPVDRAQITQGILGGIGIGRPLDAAKFFIASVAMRGFYNQRGEGMLADLAGRLGTSKGIVQNPVGAAKLATQSILDARRPLFFGMNAERLVDVDPKNYTDIVNAVNDVQRNKDIARESIYAAISNLPQEKQQEVVGRFDKMMSALIARQPDNLEIGDRLSEQARQYGIFARSIMDHAYGTQVMAQGGPEAETAAEALRALGPEGQQYIDAMEQDLRMAINESKQLQANKDVIAAYQSIKSKSSKGGIRMGGAGRFHLNLKAPTMGKGLTLPGSVGATGMTRTVNAFSGVSGQQR